MKIVLFSCFLVLQASLFLDGQGRAGENGVHWFKDGERQKESEINSRGVAGWTLA